MIKIISKEIMKFFLYIFRNFLVLEF